MSMKSHVSGEVVELAPRVSTSAHSAETLPRDVSKLTNYTVCITYS